MSIFLALESLSFSLYLCIQGCPSTYVYVYECIRFSLLPLSILPQRSDSLSCPLFFFFAIFLIARLRLHYNIHLPKPISITMYKLLYSACCIVSWIVVSVLRPISAPTVHRWREGSGKRWLIFSLPSPTACGSTEVVPLSKVRGAFRLTTWMALNRGYAEFLLFSLISLLL